MHLKRAVKICPAIKDCLGVAAGILQAVLVPYMQNFSKLFWSFLYLGAMYTFKHLAPALEEAHASVAQVAALSPAPSNWQCHRAPPQKFYLLANAAWTLSQVSWLPRVPATDSAALESEFLMSSDQPPFTLRGKTKLSKDGKVIPSDSLSEDFHLAGEGDEGNRD